MPSILKLDSAITKYRINTDLVTKRIIVFLVFYHKEHNKTKSTKKQDDTSSLDL